MKKATFLFLLLAFAVAGSLMGQAIRFEIRNEQVVGNNYEFDVYMAADQNGTYHSRGQVYIKYNATAFGNNPAQNGRVVYTHLDLLNEGLFFSPTTPKYTTINMVDNYSDGANLVITWNGNFLNLPPSTNFHTPVADSMRPLYHIAMRITNTSPSKDVQLNENLMFNPSQTFFLIAAATEVAYANGNLPVEMLDFTAVKLNEEEVQLNWLTANEQNNDYFLLEKKRDNGEFEAIGQVDGAGTTNEVSSYEFVDRSTMGGVNAYRLRQVDFDGTISFSDVIEIFFDRNDQNEFTVYPSPATDFTFVKANTKLDQDYRIYVSDLSGKLLSTSVLSKDAANGEVKINLGDYTEGLYFVRVVSPLGKSYTDRFLKVNP